jgi:hypothetical protein
MKLSLLLAAFLAWCAPALSANTWIVDVNNGPGTNFTSLPAATAAASPGDTLLILPGVYTATTCNKPLRMVGVGGNPLNPVVVVSLVLFDLPPNSVTAVANLTTAVDIVALTVQNCQGSILFQSMDAWNVTVQNSADVRFRNLVTEASCILTNSRVEIADSSLTGRTGNTCICCDFPQTGGPGSSGLSVSGGEVHVIRTSVSGGGGGGSTCGDTGLCGADGGNGGAGIRLTNNARLLVSGPAENQIRGGAAGIPDFYCTSFPGTAGPALDIAAGSQARISGQSIVGTIVNLGTLTQPALPDPYLRAVGDPTSGSNWTLRVSGQPGSTVQVRLGRRPTLSSPTPELDEEAMCPVHRVFNLGTIPAEGTISMNFPIPLSWDPGFSVVFQALVTPTAGAAQYTQSLPAVLN